MNNNELLNKKLCIYNRKNFRLLVSRYAIPERLAQGIELAANIFPFRVNSYVAKELIDWHRIPKDPIFQLTFSQPEMLNPLVRRRMDLVIATGGGQKRLKEIARLSQLDLNVPVSYTHLRAHET